MEKFQFPTLWPLRNAIVHSGSASCAVFFSATAHHKNIEEGVTKEIAETFLLKEVIHNSNELFTIHLLILVPITLHINTRCSNNQCEVINSCRLLLYYFRNPLIHSQNFLSRWLIGDSWHPYHFRDGNKPWRNPQISRGDAPSCYTIIPRYNTIR